MEFPSLDQIKENYNEILPYINVTPMLHWISPLKDRLIGDNTEVFYKCELFQRTGTFKIRGALTRMLHLTFEEKQRGVVAGTGGNHGIAVAHVAKQLGIDAKIIVPETMNPLRLEKIKNLGADIKKMPTIGMVIDEMNVIAKSEGRVIIHPFEHPKITLGTASLGYEFLQQVPNLDVILVPVGGGGLVSGISCAAKQINPDIKVFGIEPEGANAMFLSFKQNRAVALTGKPLSIADSLCAPSAEPYSYGICRQFVDEIILVSDQQIRQSMKILFEHVKVACEPACATAMAALLGPLKERCNGKRTGLILCGSNIDLSTFYDIVTG
ncbi:MAG: threonine/serine dehydratase [Chlamydiales bacterium]|nr:threonine/serine dehydratase [Chlamydiia bacterium]MCP5507258.1 threonine/serine dehydratase [Chlamydiales bacterium]